MIYPLPTDFVDRIQLQYPNDFALFLNALELPNSLSLRINSEKYSQPIHLEQVPWNPHGYYTPADSVFGLDPLWHAGAYYVQEASSMFLYELLRQHAPALHEPLVLDLCAAPGGKSTLLAEFFLPLNGWVVANEVIPNRLSILKENLTRWGLPNVCTTPFKPRFWSQFQNLFDLVLVDAPCSGEGLFRKDPKARLEWSNQGSYDCSVRQKDILDEVIPSIKDQGLLIYSTCTFNPLENEGILEYLSKTYSLDWLSIQLPLNSPVTPVGNGYAFLPHKVKGEGFFIAVARVTRKQPDMSRTFKTKAMTHNSALKELPHPNWFEPANQASIKLLEPHTGYLFCPQLAKHYPILHSFLPWDRILQPITQLKGKNWAPVPESGTLLPAFKKNHVRMEVDLQQALKFIAKGDPNVSPPRKDYFVLSFKGVDLGWIKALGNRNNNLYPLKMKLKSSKWVDPKRLPQSYFS